MPSATNLPAAAPSEPAGHLKPSDRPAGSARLAAAVAAARRPKVARHPSSLANHAAHHVSRHTQS